MNNYTSIPDAIKSAVTMPDVIGMYLPGVRPQHNRVPCPIHSGTDYNLWFSKTGYHCFVCGASGDVLRFAGDVLGLPFPAVLDRLNTDFALGLPIDRPATMAEQRELAERRRAIQAERDRDELQRNILTSRYWAHFAEWNRLDQNRRKHAPKAPTDDFDPRWIEAVRRIDFVAYCLDLAQVELFEYLRKR